MEIKTKIKASDLKGAPWDNKDCPGYRAFRRAYWRNLLFFRFPFMDLRWAIDWSVFGSWRSLNEDNEPMLMPYLKKEDIGKTVIFRNESID